MVAIGGGEPLFMVSMSSRGYLSCKRPLIQKKRRMMKIIAGAW